MTFYDSRQGPGTLKLGTTAYSEQMTNVRLTPSHTDVEGTPTLADLTPDPTVETTWVLAGTLIQDYLEAAGFIEYCRTNNNTQVAFEWVPNTADGAKFTGTCLVKAMEFGGDVKVQTTTDFEFPVIGAITRAVS